MKGILGDALRLYGASVYWNIRKTLFRLRRTRGRCPCQHHSDSGVAWETACAAITHWDRPERFRRVCPLLRQRPDGVWRCSVDAADVRPFWGRATALFGGTALTVLLVGVLGAFIAMRTIGYEVSLRQIAWPPAWSELARVRAAHFIEQSELAEQEGRIKESLLALYNAYELDPYNYPVGLRLARLWQVNQPAISDRVYRRLLNDHPEQRAETARLWMRAMLARGDMDGVARLAAERLLRDTQTIAAWQHALVFASTRLQNHDLLDALLTEPRLPAEAAVTLRLVADTVGLPPAEERGRLIQAVLEGRTDAYGNFYIGRRLLRLGFPEETLALTLRENVALNPRERVLLRLDALAALGRDADRARLFDQFLQSRLSDTGVTLLCTHLIRHPDAALADRLFTRAASGEADVAGLRYDTRLALFCLAGVLADETRLDETAAKLRALGGGEFRTLGVVRTFFLRRTQGGQIEAVLPILQPLPLEVTYALLETNTAP
ncbi:MAG: hypothetical protein ABII82_04465 [Verrucomicrobiota bacterium]